MSDRFDVIVLGIGAMGSSACWELARRGVRVLGIEQFSIPNDRGSSHGFSRMIRLAYYEHADYVPLLRRSYERWEELEKTTGQKLLYITGGIYMGPPASELVAGALKAAQMHGLEHELISHADLQQRYPQFELPADHVGVFEPAPGFLLPERVIATYVEDALARGAEIHGQETVESWSDTGSGVQVKTSRGEYHADQLIVCGGPWNAKLLRDLGVPLVVTRQVLAWVWPKQPALFELGTLPVWAIHRPAGGIWYGFPMMADSPGFKIAVHCPAEAADPDTINRNVSTDDEEPIRMCLRNYIPRADGPILSTRTCMYTMTPDSHFIVDRHPRQPRVLMAAGFSGHGFKFASVVGEILADYTTRGRTDLSANFLRLSRFSA